jgi:predicted hydrocarbon binding protein
MSEEQMKPPEAAGQQPEKPEEQAPAPAAGEAAKPAAPAAKPEGQAPAPASGETAKPEKPPAAQPAAPAAGEPAKPAAPAAKPTPEPASAEPAAAKPAAAKPAAAEPPAQPAKPAEPAAAKPPEPAKPAAAAPAPAEPAKKIEGAPAVIRDKAAITEEGNKLFYPNKWARIVLTSAEEVMGTQGVNALLNMAHMKELIGNYPPDNMKKQFDFNQMGQLQQGIWDMYGNRGARVFAVRAGEQSFKDGLTQFKAVAQAADVAMRVGSLEAKAKLGLEFFSRFFNSVSDQKVVVSEDDKHWIWTITTCPVCWGRETEEPCCHLAVGVLQAAFAWVSQGKKFRILETECKAKGDENCVIMIEKIPVE